jgi:hypothetical protein
MTWGPEIRNISVPEGLSGVVEAFDIIIPKYRLFLIAFGGVIALLLWLFLERSRVGAMVRAGVDDAGAAPARWAHPGGAVDRRQHPTRPLRGFHGARHALRGGRHRVAQHAGHDQREGQEVDGPAGDR